MLAYYISGSNNYSMRVSPTGSSNLVLQLQDMYTLVNTSSSVSASTRPYTYQPYEGILNWTASITSASIGEQYRAVITDGTASIWHGSINVFTTQPVSKANYVNQIPLENVYVSNVTDNEYIILD